ncbi:hypothetical protein BDR04DRAFT_1160553 [Suillus decipiens]|nr:hypothetical protein BDR04DRAFT_1160553 [Suillus decipiens]
MSQNLGRRHTRFRFASSGLALEPRSSASPPRASLLWFFGASLLFSIVSGSSDSNSWLYRFDKAATDIMEEEGRSMVDRPRSHAPASVVPRVTYTKSAPTANADLELVHIRRVVEHHFQVTVHTGAYLVNRAPLLRYLLKARQD